MTLRGHAARTCRPLVVDGTRVEAVAVDDARRHVQALGRGLAEAQEAGDVGALDSLLSDDCTVVGPSGKVLDKKRWLELFRSGALVMRSVEWVDVGVTSHGTVAVAVGRQTHVAEYRRRSADGRFRVTLVAVRSGDRWRVVALHASAITAGSGRGQGGRTTTRTRRTARKRHTVESDDRLIEDIRAGRVSPDDPERLVSQVMTTEPYAHAERVFLRGRQRLLAPRARLDRRMTAAWPTARLVHLPVHASWLDRIVRHEVAREQRHSSEEGRLMSMV